MLLLFILFTVVAPADQIFPFEYSQAIFGDLVFKPSYKMEQIRTAEWKRLYDHVDRTYTAPSYITLEEILQIQVLLKMNKSYRSKAYERAPVGERVYPKVLDDTFYHD